MTTLRQIEANQRNAQHSTGPRTDEGKDASKRNALKHGLAGAGVVMPEDDEVAIRTRYDDWAEGFRPGTPYQRWLIEVIALNSVRLDRCMRHDLAEQTTQSLRARFCWDDDRRLAAERLGERLTRRPAFLAKQLEQTPQGCDWLMQRWEMLGQVLAGNGEWTEPQRTLALDLLGTPIEFRDAPSPLDGDRNTLVRKEIERLGRHKEMATTLDDRDRALTESRRAVEPTATLRDVRRYEGRCSRLLNWAMAQYCRATLGAGLLSPTLGFPTPIEPEDLGPVPEPVPVPEPESFLSPAEPPVPAPDEAEATPPIPVAAPAAFTLLPIRVIPRVPILSVLGTTGSTPTGNRHDRRAQKVKARHS